MFRSQPTKSRIVLQRALLLTRRHVLVVAEPVSSVSLVRVILRAALIRYGLPSLRRTVLVRRPLTGAGRIIVLSQTGRRHSDRQDKHRRRHPSRH
jgi:hypothetical protein